ncbi:MAG: transporter substrate-binding domain-containing protein [Elusimicrobiota bacterium]|jgi:L-cystine transport system substrate-binding protein|nr:transporter substrate-binding domain-containing protein [Elusimicrobiota bacterium]
MKIKKLAAVVVLVGVAALVSSSIGFAAEPKKVFVGAGSAFKPYTYVDDKGQPAGYDVEVLKAVNKLLPQYEFVYQSLEFKNILVSLGSKKIDIGTQQFEENEERRAKFLFSNEGFTVYNKYIVVRKGRTDIKSLDDLQGKSISVAQGSNSALVIKKYNDAHPKTPIKIVYYQGGQYEAVVASIASGQVDATIQVKRVLDDWNRTYGNKLSLAFDVPASVSDTYFIFNKSDRKLRDDVDGALKKLKASGELSALSIQILGADYTPEGNQEK